MRLAAMTVVGAVLAVGVGCPKLGDDDDSAGSSSSSSSGGASSLAGTSSSAGPSSTPGSTSGTASATSNTPGSSSAATESTSATASSGAGSSSSSAEVASSSGVCLPDAQPTTVQDIASSQVGPGIAVKLMGVVATSQKFLVAKSNTSLSCLWGVFVSAPELAETAPHSGMLVLNYGSLATVADGGTQAFCPRLGLDAVGDQIPDDVKPGDVLDLVGTTTTFLNSSCANQPNGAQVGQKQVANVCSVTRRGSASLPTAHLVTPEEIAQLASPADAVFHDQWGGVRVRLENVSAGLPDAGSPVDQYGVIHLNGSGLAIGDKLYYRAYAAAADPCRAGPAYTLPTQFTYLEAISYLDFCTWGLQINDKCADLNPPSPDCMVSTCE